MKTLSEWLLRNELETPGQDFFTLCGLLGIPTERELKKSTL